MTSESGPVFSKYEFQREELKNKVVGKTCPVCGKSIVGIGYFPTPDETGVTGMLIHSYKTVHAWGGEFQSVGEQCCVTDEIFDKLMQD